jgi:hypothetical protein
MKSLRSPFAAALGAVLTLALTAAPAQEKA